MTVTIDQAYISAYSDNVHRLVSQEMSKVRPLVNITSEKGEKIFKERFGALTVSDVTGRWQDTVPQDTVHSRRMITTVKKSCPAFLDNIDLLKMMIDPTSNITQEMASAHGREFDDVMIAAMLGSAATGVAGAGTQAFDSNFQVAHGSVGFTVAKFNSAMTKLEAAEVDIDREELFLLLGAGGVEDLMAEEKFTSFDYAAGKALSSRGLPSFRGVNIIRTQRVPAHTAGSVYRGLLLTGKAMAANISKDIEIHADVIPHKNHAIQIVAYMTYGAVRMEESLIVDVLFQ